jgi:hypothetical protein
MTEQSAEQSEQSEHFDDIDKLSARAEYVQTLHAKALQELQANEGQLLDKTAYHAKRKLLTDAHSEATKVLLQAIEETKAKQRKNLALELRYEGNTETDKQAWFHAVEMVEGAKTIEQQEELVHRALRWGDKALARALCLRFGGVPEYKAMHMVLAGVDERVKALYDFESKHGAFAKKSPLGGTWAGWKSYGKWDIPDIPGRAPELQPAYQKRLRMEQQNKQR